MAIIQSQIANRVVYLSLSGAAATSVPYSAVTVNYLKSGQTSFTVKALTSGTWINLGLGFYSIGFTALEMDVVGDFMYTMSSADFDNFKSDQFTIEPQVILNPVLQPNQCAVSGSVFTQNAQAPQGLRIIARPAQFPASDNGNILAADAVWAYPDSIGNFTLILIQNSIVLITIERTGIYNVQITVPASDTANLLDLLPALPYDYTTA
jgi:hypothetical protein